MKKKMTNDKFEKEFDEFVKQKKQLKEEKKIQFKSNIQSHLVVSDEFGNVHSVDEKKEPVSKKNINGFELFLILLILCLISYLVYTYSYLFV